MDSLDYSQELRQSAKEFKQFAFDYKRARALYAEALNNLTSLIYITGLHSDIASLETKLTKLLATDQAEAAQEFIEQLNSSRAEYKGLEMVLESYKAQISAIQSVIKYNLTAEVNTNIVNKYERIY
jgi:hypothetical protein